MNILGYKQVSYSELQKSMKRVYADYREKKTELELAVSLKVKSPQTVRNAFRVDYQMVSDELLTSLSKEIGLNVCVIWQDGERGYFIPKIK